MPQEYEKSRQRQLMNARMRDIKQKRLKAKKTIKKYAGGKHKKRTGKTIRRTSDIKNRLLKSPRTLFGLHAHISFATDWAYAVAIMFAVLKDILDPILVSLASALTWTVVLALFGGMFYAVLFVATVMASVVIWFMMLLTSIMEKKNNFIQRRIIRAYLVLILTTAIEIIPGLNVMPFETFAILIIYIMTLQDRKMAAGADKVNAEEKARLKRLADQDMMGRNQELAERRQEMSELNAEQQQIALANNTADDYPTQQQKAA